MLTFLQLKNLVRSHVFPAGEARNLRVVHDKSMADALVDVQRWVDCIQNNNTFLAPHCATFYNCGLTSFDMPRSRIKSLFVVDSTPASSSSSTGSSSDSTTNPIDPGTIVATVNDCPGFMTEPYQNALYEVVESQPFLVALLAGNSQAALFPPNSPQYVRPSLIYTDTDGVEQSVVLGREVHANDLNVNSSVIILPKAGTTISYTWTVSNSPRIAVAVCLNFTVTAQAIGTPVSQPGDTVSGGDTKVLTNNANWCDEIYYRQVDPCVIHRYLAGSRSSGCCGDFTRWFAIPSCLSGNKSRPPVPTDEGVDPTLPPLQLGYHYPQESTDTTHRAKSGVWAIENGRIYIAPWIQSTETVVVKWEGIKRDWVDTDLVDDDPDLIRAVELFLRWEHARDWDEKNLQRVQAYERDYGVTLSKLIYDCAEETRVRSCEPSNARGIARPDVDTGFTPDTGGSGTGGTGGTGGSGGGTGGGTPPTTPPTTTQFYNKEDAVGHAFCASLQEAGAPEPTGPAATAIVSAGTVPGTSYEEAQALAQEQADAIAAAQLSGTCTFRNREMSATAKCPPPTTGSDNTYTEPAETHSSKISQANADGLAYQAAQVGANAGLVCNAAPAPLYWNDYYSTLVELSCFRNGVQCFMHLKFYSLAHKVSSPISKQEANHTVRDAVNAKAGNAELLPNCGNYPLCGAHIDIEVDPTGNDIFIDDPL